MESKYKNFNLGKESAQNVFDKFDLGTVDKIYQFKQGMINNVYSINDQYVLKVNSAHPNTPKLANEAAVYKALSSSPIPVPEFYAYDDSRELLKHPYILIEQIQGRTLKEAWKDIADKKRKSKAFKTGKLLGAIHNIKPKQVEIKNSEFTPDLKKSINSQIRDIGSKLRDNEALDKQIIKRIEKYFKESSAFNTEVKPSLLHGNYVFANIITSNNLIKGIIDWEWSSFGHNEEELAVTLYRGPTGITGGMSENLISDFKEGYLSNHKISYKFNERYLLYVLIYFLKILPDVSKWTHRPDKQKEYIDATNKLIDEIGL